MPKHHIRIASYNIRKARGLDQRRNPERIVQIINGLDADVVALQEADLRLGSRPAAIPRALIEKETDFELVEVSPDGPSLGWHGNAVLIRKDLAVREVRKLNLPGLEPRGAVGLTVDHGEGLTLIATHLGLLRRHRRAQLHALNEATQHAVNCMIVGDFNEWSLSKGFEPLAHRFEVHSPGRSFHAKLPMAALDRIAVSGNLSLLDAGVDQSALARIASDHLPIWSDIAAPRPIC